MAIQISEETAKGNIGFVILSSPNQFDHRGMVLRGVCQLEYDFKLLLIEVFRQINPLLPDSLPDERRSMFSTDGAFGSLSKCLSTAKLLGIVDADLADDLRAMVDLRNMYAHGRKREQFKDDPQVIKLLREMHLVKNSAAVLASHDEQGIFLSALQTLEQKVGEMTKDLRTIRESA